MSHPYFIQLSRSKLDPTYSHLKSKGSFSSRHPGYEADLTEEPSSPPLQRGITPSHVSLFSYKTARTGHCRLRISSNSSSWHSIWNSDFSPSHTDTFPLWMWLVADTKSTQCRIGLHSSMFLIGVGWLSLLLWVGELRWSLRARWWTAC